MVEGAATEQVSAAEPQPSGDIPKDNASGEQQDAPAEGEEEKKVKKVFSEEVYAKISEAFFAALNPETS